MALQNNEWYLTRRIKNPWNSTECFLNKFDPFVAPPNSVRHRRRVDCRGLSPQSPTPHSRCGDGSPQSTYQPCRLTTVLHAVFFRTAVFVNSFRRALIQTSFFLISVFFPMLILSVWTSWAPGAEGSGNSGFWNFLICRPRNVFPHSVLATPSHSLSNCLPFRRFPFRWFWCGGHRAPVDDQLGTTPAIILLQGGENANVFDLPPIFLLRFSFFLHFFGSPPVVSAFPK